MNLCKTVLALAALAIGSLTIPTAHAVSICAGCVYVGDATYLGSHDPTTGDGSTFTHTEIADGQFSDVWLFEIDPSGNVAINATFIPTDDISNFDIKLYSATPGCAPGAPGTLCAGTTTLNLIADATTNPNFLANINFVGVAAGFYAFVVSGFVTDNSGVANDFYSGNLTTQPTPVAEPSTLALLGFGMFFTAVMRRRRA